MRSIFRFFVMTLFVLSLTGMSYGQMNIGFKGVGAKFGIAGPDGVDGSPIMFGGLVDLGNITDAIRFGAFVDYWSKSIGSSDGSSSAEVDFSALTIAAMGYYYFPNESKAAPYVAAGLGFIRSKVGFDFDLGGFLSGSRSASTTDLSISVAGGVDLELSPKATGRAEFKYNLGGIDYWAITGGVIFAMGN